MFKHHVLAALIAALMSAGAGGYVVHYEAHRPPIVVHAAQAKLHFGDWPGLSDDESAALTAALGKLDKQTVSIFCSTPNCQDLAEDFGDAQAGGSGTGTASYQISRGTTPTFIGQYSDLVPTANASFTAHAVDFGQTGSLTYWLYAVGSAGFTSSPTFNGSVGTSDMTAREIQGAALDEPVNDNVNPGVLAMTG